jgi:hypothetical protein
VLKTWEELACRVKDMYVVERKVEGLKDLINQSHLLVEAFVPTLPFHSGTQGHGTFDAKSTNERMFWWWGCFLFPFEDYFSHMAHYERSRKGRTRMGLNIDMKTPFLSMANQQLVLK